MRIDKYFEKQPAPGFLEKLSAPMHETAPVNFGRGVPDETQADASGMYLVTEVVDPEGLLETAFSDLEAFLEVCGIGGNRYPVRFLLREGEAESYTLTVTEQGAVVEAADIEGIRRAVYFLEEQMTMLEGAILPLGILTKKQSITKRITRGFFSPTNRAPKWGDELLDEIDYYPEGYLNRLAHNGTNGLWIYTSFAQLIQSPYFPEHGENGDKRMEKLAAVVEKCRRYGIGVYVFAIEPMGLLSEEAQGHEELLGAAIAGADARRCICLRTEEGKEHVIYCLSEIFRRIPHLKGYIDITAGERPTNCASTGDFSKCPRCGRYSRGENLAYSVDVIKEGLRRAGTDAEFISWTYGHRYWAEEDILDYVDHAPEDVILMQNFEDRGFDVQLGKTRVAWDYWLSYVGPSPVFELTAARAAALEKKSYAKMQVCSSHEIATVPYIPAPGILFDKYKAARTLGVSGIMECWYFGNYPSLMNKASTALSYLESFDEKETFLQELAASLYGKSKAPAVAESFKWFESSYRSYPTNIMFSYYGPMHDGVVWDLFPIPVNQPLPRSWLLLDPPDGDRIGECLYSGHTLDEALILAKKMTEDWQKGLALLPFGEECELVTCAKAIGVLFESGYHILRFYKLRSLLGTQSVDPMETVTEMEEIVSAEIQNSKEMARLCRLDPRLGYHSEAEGFKFFPEKLLDRAGRLEKLFDTDFAAIRKRLQEGRAPLGYYLAEEEDCYALTASAESASWITLSPDKAFRAYIEDDGITLDIRCGKEDDFAFCYEFELFRPEPEIIYRQDAESSLHREIAPVGKVFEPGLALGISVLSHQGVFGDMIPAILSEHTLESHAEGRSMLHTVHTVVPKEKWDRKHAVKLNLLVGGIRWKQAEDAAYTLGRGDISYNEFGYLLPIS